MNKDRELLLLAAKAAGLVVVDDSPAVTLYVRAEGYHGGVRWNPLADSEDSFELSVCLGFSIEQWQRGVEIKIGDELIHRELSDGRMNRPQLTRRAITRAAAAIQLAKETK